MVIFEHNFRDGSGIRIATYPNQRLKREIPVVQFRVEGKGIIDCPMYDFDEKLDLFDILSDKILELKLEEIGRQCDRCDNFFLPASPAQKHCDKCKESK